MTSATIREPVRIAAGAVIGAGTTIGPDAVVGAGAVVSANVKIERAVIWPGAKVSEDAVDAIVTPTQRQAVTGSR